MNIPARFVFPLCLIVSVMFYFNILQNGVALDDVMVLSENTYVKDGIGGWWDILSHDSFYGSTMKPATQLSWRYRPLSLLLFALTYEFTGPQWQVFHGLSILLYACCCWRIFCFFKSVLFPDKPGVALAGALFFLILPVHTEVVANIKSCDELLALLFTVLCLEQIGKINPEGKLRSLLPALSWFILALFAKESAITTVVLIPLFLFVRGMSLLASLKKAIPFALAGIGFVAVRISISSVPESSALLTTDPYLMATAGQKIATILFVLLEYLRLMVWPAPLIFDYSYNHIPYKSLTDTSVILSLILHLSLLLLGVWLTMKKRWMGIFVLAYLGGIVLLSNLFINVGPILAERFLFSPGLFLLGAILIGIGNVLPKKVEIILPGLLLVSAIPCWSITVNRNKEWKDNNTLYAADVKKAPDSFRTQAFHAMALAAVAEDIKDSTKRAASFRTCIQHFRAAYSIYPGYKLMYREWGFSHYSLGQLDSAEWAWSRFRDLNPTSRFNAINDRLISDAKFMGLMQEYNQRYTQGNLKELSVILESALRYKPQDPTTLSLLAKVYFLDGKRDSAITCWERALRADSTLTEVRQYLIDYRDKSLQAPTQRP
jgi:tetratricopeptide (TPR) repeat protein